MQAIVTSSHGLKLVTYAGAGPDWPKMRDPLQPAGHTYCWRESSRRFRHAEAQADCSNIHQGKPDRQRQSTIWFRRREVGRSSLSKLGGRPTLPNEPVALCCRASTAVYLRGRRRCGHVARHMISLQMISCSRYVLRLPAPTNIRTDCAAALNAVSIRACYLAGQLLTSCEVIE